MRILIFGAGGVGLGLGSFLLAAGARVDFLARPATGQALRERGLVRGGVFGSHTASPDRFRVAARMDELGEIAPDFVLVTVKSFDSEQAAAEIAGRIGSAPVVLCQNGWGNAGCFAARLPAIQVWNARVITGFQRPDPHRVEITVHAEPLRIGSLFGGDVESIGPLVKALTEGGIPCEATQAIGADLWAKLLYNGCLNPACAVLGIPYGALGATRAGRSLITAVAHEIFAVMRAAGWRTHWDDADAYLADFFERLLPPTAAHESSTLQDLRAGRPTEIAALNGAVCRLAQQHEVPAPVNQALVHLVETLEERRARTRGVATRAG